ncbi:RING finger protein 145 homolog [Diorhabda carinulata]|uniref:RING finger protein 145 homolog n=1 Tax=Diorhabda carinulata TaxID=1163345 RepID=UPI0025A1B9C3|nr:RING finger protein 145 homolog [Diorhabda carinulata]
MGMITRVRGRLRSLHTLPKLDPQERDEKIAETVCLLSVLFLLPYCSRGHSPLILSLGGWCLASYSFLVLPVLISANYKYPMRWLRQLGNKIVDLFMKYYGPVCYILYKIYEPLDKCEKVFMKMSNISNLITQLIFFMMCDRVLLCDFGGTNCPQKKITGLYSLMFYNVIAYCTSYIKELVEKEDWSVTVRMTQHSNIKHVAMSATKIVLEWTKAVTFIITVTFMLLVFGLEQGLEHYQPTALYTFVTWTYYMCTEKVFVELFLPLLLSLKLKSLEALEPLYAPVLLRYYTIGLAVIIVTLLSFHGQLRFTALSFHLTVFLRTKDLVMNYLKKLKAEQALLGQFRYATHEEIRDCDDVCAVCLSAMERARVTPCQHMFHAVCLRQCLNNSSMCPICKRQYTFVH